MTLYDYCLLPYEAPAGVSCVNGASEALLYATMDSFAEKEKIISIVSRLKKILGPNRTVWGIKKKGDELVWEFYFYNWEGDKQNSLEKVQSAFAPYISYELCPEVYKTNYFMHSVDINLNALKSESHSCINLYYGKTSYLCYADKLVLENLYFFVPPQPPNARKELISRIKSSAFVDYDFINISDVLWQEYIDCYTVCRAYKKEADALYYSRISYKLLKSFLHKFDYPQGIINYIENNSASLSPMLFDVGFDYRQAKKSIQFLKTGFYGYF